MRSNFVAGILFLAVAACLAGAQEVNADHPQFNSKGELLRPDNYREWIFLGSNIGMSYRQSPEDPDPMYTNVFAPQWQYQEFLKSGHWPDGSIWVVEDRGSSSKGSITKRGRFQTGDFMGIGVEVKDSKRFPDKFAYFNFGDAKTATPNPKQNCWQCHNDHAAVENTFVQFYPTLKPVAMKFGTYWHEVVPGETDWNGTLEIPQQMKTPVVLHLYNTGDQVAATVDVPSQDKYDAAISPVTLNGNQLAMDLGDGKFSGTMEGDKINGTYSDKNGKTPVVLTKMAAPGPKPH
jgi:hypothetical protein